MSIQNCHTKRIFWIYLGMQQIESITTPANSFATIVDNLQYSYEGPEQTKHDWQPDFETLQYEPELRKVFNF